MSRDRGRDLEEGVKEGEDECVAEVEAGGKGGEDSEECCG